MPLIVPGTPRGGGRRSRGTRARHSGGGERSWAGGRRLTESEWERVPDDQRLELLLNGRAPEDRETMWRTSMALVAQRQRELEGFRDPETGLDESGFDEDGLWQGWDAMRPYNYARELEEFEEQDPEGAEVDLAEMFKGFKWSADRMSRLRSLGEFDELR